MYWSLFCFFFVVFSSHLSVAILFRRNLISADMLSIQLRHCHCDLPLIFPLLISRAADGTVGELNCFDDRLPPDLVIDSEIPGQPGDVLLSVLDEHS